MKSVVSGCDYRTNTSSNNKAGGNEWCCCDAGVGSAGRRLNNRGITGEGVTVLRNSVGANKRARNHIQQQLSEVGFISWSCSIFL